MKKILLHGYTMNNLGDDLFFRVIAARYPDTMFYLPTLNVSYREKFADAANLRIVDFWQVARLTTRKIYMLPKLYSRLNIRKFDGVVCIGGSLFIDQKNPGPKHRTETEQYSFVHDWEIAHKAGVPYYVLGANWGPCYNDYFRAHFSKVFDTLTDLCFRDRASLLEFSEKPAARCTGDILMGNPLIRHMVRNVQRKKQIAISVVDAGRKSEQPAAAARYEQVMAELCRDFTGRGYQVALLSFCRWEGDEQAAERIRMQAGCGDAVRILRYHQNMQEMLETMAASELIVAARFHAAVLGWTMDRPVYTIAYSNKTIHLLEDCGIRTGFCRIHHMPELTAEQVCQEAVRIDPEQYSGAGQAFCRLDELLR